MLALSALEATSKFPETYLSFTCSEQKHSASYILGPLKSRLSREMGTDNTEFSLLISAFSLNSTWTPLVGGLLASRLGTTFTSILATGVVFLGTHDYT